MTQPGHQIAIRCDYSSHIGSGHLFRCLTLANQLNSIGKKVLFVSANPDPRQRFGLDFPHDWKELPDPGQGNRPSAEDTAGNHAHFLTYPQEEDAELFLQTVAGAPLEWIIVDHYGLDRKWHQLCRQTGARIAVIDDLADRPLDCDLLIDQNRTDRSSAVYDKLVPQHCKKLIGPQYALLGAAFSRLHQHQHPRKSLDHVLVFFGSSDPSAMVARLMPVISDGRYSGIEFTVISGALAADDTRMVSSENITVINHTADIAGLLDQVDLAIGSCGTHSLERACLGVPAICLPIAENQLQLFKMLDEYDAIFPVPGDQADPVAQIRQHLDTLMDTPMLLENKSRSAYSLTDGKGGEKIISCLYQ